MNNITFCDARDMLAPTYRGEKMRCQLSADHVQLGTMHRWVHSDGSSEREWCDALTQKDQKGRFKLVANDNRTRMTMGDIARELILLGTDGTYKQVHGRVRSWRIRGKLPEPDASVGDTPYWRRGTIIEWLTTGGHL